MDTRKRGRREAGFNANGGIKKSKPELESLSTGVGSKSNPCTKFFRFQVKKKQFFCNFISIILFGAIGTLVSCTIISLGISNDLMEAIYSSADVLKQSTSIHWNKKRQSGFQSMKKKNQGATNEIRNVARIGHYTIPREMNEVCNWLTGRLALEG